MKLRLTLLAPPSRRCAVGVFDVATSTFSTVRTVGLSTHSVMKFHGAAALGARVFFAPHLQDSIGVLDATTSTFSTITPAAGRVLNPETGGMSSSVSWFGRKYAGATVLGTNVYFTPYARCARHRTLDLTSSGASVLSRACGPIATAQDADAVGVLRTSEPPPAATNASCAVVLPADQNDPSRLPPSAPAHAALPSSSRPAASPPLEQLPPLLPPLLQIVLIPASIFLCASIAFGVYLQRVSRRSANLRRSRDRAQLDLQLLAHQVRVQMEPPCDDGQHSCEPSASIPSMPLSTLDPDEPPALQTTSSSGGTSSSSGATIGAKPNEEEREKPTLPADAAPPEVVGTEHEALETEMADAAQPQQPREPRKRRCHLVSVKYL